MDRNKSIIFIQNVVRVLFLTALVLLSIIVLSNPKKTQTNILNAILSDTANDEILIDLSQKQSENFSIIFESKEIEDILNAKKEFEDKISDLNFLTDTSKTADVREILSSYKYYSSNLLSENTFRQLKNNDFEVVKLEALERLYNPMSINILPVEEDPFMLFGDYIQSLGSPDASGIMQKNGIFYDISNYKLKDKTSLSPSILNKNFSKIINIKKSIEREHKNVKIYTAGAPVHTYYASSKSMKEINLICILSSLFIILLCKFYFKTFKILVPIGTSLVIGILSGYLLTSLFFDSVHILTYVFSTTLIGICVDYSLHFFAHDNDISSVLKSLTISMITTICAFLVLLFSNIQLLQQIAVFTAGGLFSVYIFVVMFYPLICKYGFCNASKRSKLTDIFKFHPSLKQRCTIIAFFVILGLIGVSQIHFNDEIKDMYKPPKYLANAEKLYFELTEKPMDTTFLLVKGNNIQNLLENEEKALSLLKPNRYIALSKFVPSIKKQKENRKLIHLLYQKELNNYASFLSENSRVKLLNAKEREGYLTLEKLPLPILKNFFIDSASTIVILQKTNPDEIKRILAVNPEITFLDLKNDISKKVSSCRNSCMILLLPISILLFVILSFIFKPVNALKIVAPSLIGALFSIGLLGLFHQCINLFHILAVFLIVGFSLDYSIFRFNGLKNSTASENAVLISCATSVFSFFLLSITSFKLISSLGFVLSVGLISSYILSLLLISKEENISSDEEQTDNT